MKHTAPISSIATSTKFIATTGYDNQVILWDVLSSKPLARSLHDHLANQCIFSHDETMLVSASSDYSARIWDVPSMRLKMALVGHSDDVDMASFSPDDQLVATCALDRTIKIFDLNGRCLQTFTGHTGNILSVSWSLDGKSLVSSSVDGTVREWDVLSGKEFRTTNMDGVRTDTFAIAKDGAIFAGDDKGRISIIFGGKPRYFQAHKAGIKKLLYREQDSLLATISYDRSIAIWQANGHENLTEISRSILPALIWARSGDFLNASKILLGTFGSRYATFDIHSSEWDIEDIEPSQSINAVAAHKGDVYAVGDSGVVFKNEATFSDIGSLCNFLISVGDRVLTGGQLGKLFDVATGEVLYEHHSPLNCGAAFEKSGKWHAIIGSYTGEALVFAFDANGALYFAQSIKMHENAIKGMTVNERMIFSVCANTNIAWYDIESLSLIKFVNNAHERIANGCALVGTASFASIGRDLKLRIWTENDQEVYITPHPNSVKCICAGNGRLMTGSYGGTLAGFDLATRTWTSFDRPTAAGISCITYDENNDQFLASSYDGRIYSV